MDGARPADQYSRGPQQHEDTVPDRYMLPGQSPEGDDGEEHGKGAQQAERAPGRKRGVGLLPVDLDASQADPLGNEEKKEAEYPHGDAQPCARAQVGVRGVIEGLADEFCKQAHHK